MRFNEVLCALALFSATAMAQTKGQAKGGQTANKGGQTAATGNKGNTGNTAATGNTGNTGNNAAASSALTLLASNVQKASDATGQGAAGSDAGQSASATDAANFINFCSGKTLTNGAQVKGGSCNGIVMGDIPASTAMISAIIVNPKPGDTVAANQDINFQVQLQNLVAGSFTNPTVTYYAAPQALSGGKVVGHTHVTVQSIGSLTTTTPPDPATFAFFKGINDAGNGNGLLNATATGGLPAGVYRVCTMTSASNHQPVLMPVAQRGAQDDCTKFTVSNNAAGGNANKGGNAAAAGNTGNAANTGAAKGNAGAAKGATGAATGATAAKGGKGGKAANRRFAARTFVA